MKKLIILTICLFILFGCTNQKAQEDDEEKTSSIEEINYDDEEELNYIEQRYVCTEINIRKGPSTDAEKVDVANIGEVFTVLDETEDEYYKWYKIDEDKWIADEGKWTVRYYTIKYKSNNGTKEESLKNYAYEIDDQSYYYDYCSLGSTPFQYANHIFVGWNSKPDGSGINYDEDTAIFDLCGDSSTICLYAHWIKVEESNIYVRAKTNINIFDGPSIDDNRSYGSICEGDEFTILESVQYNDKIWDRIAKDTWIINQRENLEILETEPEAVANPMNITLPKQYKIVDCANDGVIPQGSIIYTLNYNSDGTLSNITTNHEKDSSGLYDTKYTYTFGTTSLFVYGDCVKNDYDSEGRIIKQTIYGVGDNPNEVAYIEEYTYNNKNQLTRRIFNSEFFFDYNYDEDGKLANYKCYMDNDSYQVFSYEYNGNLLFSYFSNYDKEENNVTKGRYGFYRYDSTGREILKRINDYEYYFYY